VLILLLGYVYFRAAGEAYALVAIGLISFAAVAQFAPALFGGMLVNIGMYQWRYLIVTVVAALALFLVGVPATYITLIMVVFMIALSYTFYKKGIWVPKAPMASAATED